MKNNNDLQASKNARVYFTRKSYAFMFTKESIEKYFLAAKNFGLLLLVVGIVAMIACGVFFFVMKTGWHKGAAIPFLLIGLFQLFSGYNIYSKANAQRKSAVHAYDLDPSEFRDNQIPSLLRAQTSSTVFIIVEIILVLAGLGLYFYSRNDAGKVFGAGLGMALFVQAALCLFVDVSARARMTAYLKGVKKSLFHKAI